MRRKKWNVERPRSWSDISCCWMCESGTLLQGFLPSDWASPSPFRWTPGHSGRNACCPAIWVYSALRQSGVGSVVQMMRCLLWTLMTTLIMMSYAHYCGPLPVNWSFMFLCYFKRRKRLMCEGALPRSQSCFVFRKGLALLWMLPAIKWPVPVYVWIENPGKE